MIDDQDDQDFSTEYTAVMREAAAWDRSAATRLLEIIAERRAPVSGLDFAALERGVSALMHSANEYDQLASMTRDGLACCDGPLRHLGVHDGGCETGWRK